jgi:hypothetical protein
MNCDGHYNVSEGAKCAKAATVSDIVKGVKDMKIYLELDYEKGTQIEIKGGMVEEGAAGCLKQEGQGAKKEEKEYFNKMTETGAGGGHERVQDVRKGGARGLKKFWGMYVDGQEAVTGRVTLSVRETVRRLEYGMSFEKFPLTNPFAPGPGKWIREVIPPRKGKVASRNQMRS